MTSLPTCVVVRRWIERHFRGRGGDSPELRLHLRECASCRETYNRWLLVEQLDPLSLGPEQRLGVSLGVAPRTNRRSLHLWLPLAAAALLLLMVVPRFHTPAEFRARGGPITPAAPALWVYQVSPSGKGELVHGEIRRADELGFAYRASADTRFLLVFGRDEHGRIYWYHPEWTDATLDPTSIPIASDPIRHELPAAISHELEAKELEVCGVFSQHPFRLRDVEHRLEHAAVRELERVEGTQVQCRTMRVSP